MSLLVPSSETVLTDASDASDASDVFNVNREKNDDKLNNNFDSAGINSIQKLLIETEIFRKNNDNT